MYIPNKFKMDDPKLIAEVIRTYPFAPLITVSEEGLPTATPIPFHFDEKGGEMGKGRLFGHIAAGNPQKGELIEMGQKNRESLVTFMGPHAYISPRWNAEQDKPDVPTWNYITVQVYGIARPLSEENGLRERIAHLVGDHEKGSGGWSMEIGGEKFISKLLRAIFPFSLEITRIFGKAKLHQNYSTQSRQNIIEALRQSPQEDARMTAKWEERFMPDVEGV